jgi:hypothetical protein
VHDATRQSILALLAALATGCASVYDDRGRDPAVGRVPLAAEVELDHALPVSDAQRGNPAGDDLLSGRVSLVDAGGLIDYSARYSMQRGKLLRAIHDGKSGTDLADDEVARQVIEHRLTSTLPLPIGHPLEVAVAQRRLSALELDHGATRRKTTADLRWRPGGIDLNLRWKPPAPAPASGRKLDCNVTARIRVPIAPAFGTKAAALELAGQRCSGHAPTDRIIDREVSRWAATWHWGSEGNSALRLLGTDPDGPAAPAALPVADYELGLSHRHVLPSGWEAEADIAVLRGWDTARAMSGRARVTDWTGRFALRHRLDLLAITARAIHAPDVRWLATAAKSAAAGKFSLAVDFGAWLATLWPGVDSAMDVSWDWQESAKGEPDAEVRWNLVVGF